MNTNTNLLTYSKGTPEIRVVFMGTPDFAATVLDSLIKKSYNIVAVYTQPDKAVGRKQEIQTSPVKDMALAHSLPIEQPVKFDEQTIETLAAYKPDIIIVTAYGKLLPKAVLDMPGFGCVNIHPSLLPELRGPSPIQNTLIRGDKKTGITLMLLNERMDAGDILAQTTTPIQDDETFPELSKRLAIESANFLLETLPLWIERKITPQKQDEEKATLCQLIEREDGHVLWTESAETIYNAFRALYPWPGIYGFWKQQDNSLSRIKFTKISHQKNNSEAKRQLGEVFEIGEKIGVQSMEGIIFLEEVQIEGKNPTPIREFVKGYNAFIGSTLQ